MTPAEIIGMGTACGLFVGWGIVWGAHKSMVMTNKNSIDSLKAEFVRHKDNTRIHVDPERDDKTLEDLKDTMLDHFKDLKEKIANLDTRCERRGVDCSKQFLNIGQRISAATGKTNGEIDK